MSPRYLPIRLGLAISSLESPERDYCMLRGYYDGASDGKGHKFITLGGMIASVGVWERFEKAWSDALTEYDIHEFHTTDAMALEDPFLEEHGWNHEKVGELVKKLWNVIAQFRAVKDYSTMSNLTATSCTIDIADYERAKLDIPNLRPKEAICVSFCINRWPTDLEKLGEHSGKAELVFDRNEAFLRTIDRVWRSVKKNSRKSVGWRAQIIDIVTRNAITSVGTNNIYPLQATDLLAWTINELHRNPDRNPFGHVITTILVEHHKKFYDYEALNREYPNG